MTREQLVGRLWPGVHVDFDRGLANAVQKLREALEDPADTPSMVETLPRRGYRFLAPVERVASRAAGGARLRGPGSRLALALPAGAALLLSLGLAWSRPRPRTFPHPWAFEALQRGRHFAALKTPEGLEKAAAQFRQAIERDPELAPAWAGLAEAYHFQGAVGLLSPAEAYRRAREAAQRALRLDGSLAQAHAVLAETNFRFGPDDDEAERDFDRALDLHPDSATIRQWRANYLVHKGRLQEGLREMEEAQRLDPLSLHTAVDLAALLYDAGREDEAYARLLQTVELDERFPKTHFVLGHLYQEERRYDEAIAAFRRACALAPDTPKFLAQLARAYEEAGRRAEASATRDELRALRGRRHVSADLLAE